MFNLTNYKAAPYSALSFWATKTARRRLCQDTRGWSEQFYIVANAECTAIDVAQSMSILLAFALSNTKMKTTPLSFVQLHSYDRGDVLVEVGEWTAFKLKGMTHWQLGIVTELIILKFGSSEEFYMRCSRLINLKDVDFDIGYSCVKVPFAAVSGEVSVQIDDSMSMCDVHADVQGEHLVLTYYG